ncbi:MAG: hypothetical protein U1C74_09265 [Phenylobacterium sp.]|nr:hypothetical protein [Phenylobacterium sp.]
MNEYLATGLIVFAFLAGCWAGFGIGGDHMARTIERARQSHRERADG